MTRLLFGSFNRHKADEVRAALAGTVELLSCADLGGILPVDETGRTLEANAALKAEGYAAQTGLPCLADDSGLEVDALDGAPGVDSAHYAGDRNDATRHAANNAKLLAALEGVSERAARFRTVLALAVPGRPTRLFLGALEGQILTAPQGTGGFGYDPLFLPDGQARTLAEMSLDEKNALSHRGRALEAFRRALATPTPPTP